MLEFLEFTRRWQGKVCKQQPGLMFLPQMALCAHTVMEAKEPYSLPFAGWRPRNSVWVQKPENWGAWWSKAQSESRGSRTKSTHVRGQEKMVVSAQTQQPHSSAMFSFYSAPQLIGWCPPSLLTQMLIFAGDTLTNTPRNDIWPAVWAPLSPVTLI